MSQLLGMYYVVVMSPSQAGSSWRIFSSAQLMTFFHSARNQKLAKNELKFFWYFFSIKLGLKIYIFNSKNTYCHIKIQKIDHKIDYNHDTGTKLEFDCSS